MHLQQLTLRNFRSYKDQTIHFGPGLNVIQADNGKGKTNLLEAIHLISTGRSFRSRLLSDLIHFGENYFYLEAQFCTDNVSQQIKIYYDSKTRKIELNDTSLPNLTHLLGILPSVLLSPDDLSIITGAPAERRRFLDLFIAQMDPSYLYFISRYYGAMKQRNALLRARSAVAITPWEQIMASAAHEIISRRKEVLNELCHSTSKWMEILSQKKEGIELGYLSSFTGNDAPSFLLEWEKSLPREFIMGSTLLGPHRDDIEITLSSHLAKRFTSEGQKRSCIHALRFAQWEKICDLKGEPPLLGIDDFGVQLDETRQKELMLHLDQFSQVFITSPFSMTKYLGGREHQTIPICLNL